MKPLQHDSEYRSGRDPGADAQSFRDVGGVTLAAATVGAREDLHWADPTSQLLLEQLLPLTDRVPLLMVCVMRPVTAHNFWRIKEIAAREYRHRYTDVWLKALTTSESGELIGNLLRIEELPVNCVNAY